MNPDIFSKLVKLITWRVWSISSISHQITNLKVELYVAITVLLVFLSSIFVRPC